MASGNMMIVHWLVSQSRLTIFKWGIIKPITYIVQTPHTSPLLIIYIAVTPCMLYFELLFCSRPRALAACVYYVKLLPTWNKDYLSIYLYNSYEVTAHWGLVASLALRLTTPLHNNLLAEPTHHLSWSWWVSGRGLGKMASVKCRVLLISLCEAFIAETWHSSDRDHGCGASDLRSMKTSGYATGRSTWTG